MTRWTSIAQLAARQHGLVRVDQAAACGVPPTTLDCKSSEAAGSARVQGLVALPGAAATAERAIAAALLATGEHALAARWTAAYLWGLVRSAPSTVHLVVPDGRRAPRLQGVAAFRSSTLDREDAARAANLAVTSPARTLGDLAGFTDLADLPSPEQRAGVECDGYGSHSSRSQLDIDNRRHNRLVLHGWRILRVGWTEAELHPQRLTREVTELLQAARR